MTPRARTLIEVHRIAEKRGSTLAELQTPCRNARLSRIRWELYGVLQRRGWSTTQIGELFNRYHSCVVRGLRRGRELSL